MTIITLLNIIFLLVAPFFFVGIINKTKAFWGTRKGSSIFQPFFDFYKLLKKGQVISITTSYIFKITPVIALGTVFFAGLLIPMIQQKSVISFDGDFILFAYLLALAKFFSLISALDT
ncbi:MAG: NADH-quinone oxidoreductase subunit H, partial [Rickettsiales bacterium]|nr:NADH-quinone oxidoreductase subunit H [Rickettsiales bacterium]